MRAALSLSRCINPDVVLKKYGYMACCHGNVMLPHLGGRFSAEQQKVSDDSRSADAASASKK